MSKLPKTEYKNTAKTSYPQVSEIKGL